MPVSCLHWALSKSFCQIYLGVEGATSQLTCYVNCVVDCRVFKGYCLWVNKIIDATSLWCREVGDNPPGANMLQHNSHAGEVEGAEGWLVEWAGHSTLFTV